MNLNQSYFDRSNQTDYDYNPGDIVSYDGSQFVIVDIHNPKILPREKYPRYNIVNLETNEKFNNIYINTKDWEKC